MNIAPHLTLVCMAPPHTQVSDECKGLWSRAMRNRTIAFASALALAFLPSGCGLGAQIVAPKDVIAHPELHAVATVEGKLTAPFAVLPIPGRQAVLRKFVGEHADSLTVLIPIAADTLPIGKVIRITGRVRAGNAFSGLVRTGPVLTPFGKPDSLEAPQGVSPPPTTSRP